MSAAEIAKALGDAKQEGREWRALCPCHDGRPRLSLRDGDDGTLLVNCFAGCAPTDILRELRRRDLLDDRPEQREPHQDDPKPKVPEATDADRLNLAAGCGSSAGRCPAHRASAI